MVYYGFGDTQMHALKCQRDMSPCRDRVVKNGMWLINTEVIFDVQPTVIARIQHGSEWQLINEMVLTQKDFVRCSIYNAKD